MSIDLEISFEEFLAQARKYRLFLYAFNIKALIMEKYIKKGMSREQIFKNKLKEFWPLIQDYKTRRRDTFYIKKPKK